MCLILILLFQKVLNRNTSFVWKKQQTSAVPPLREIFLALQMIKLGTTSCILYSWEKEGAAARVLFCVSSFPQKYVTSEIMSSFFQTLLFTKGISREMLLIHFSFLCEIPCKWLKIYFLYALRRSQGMEKMMDLLWFSPKWRKQQKLFFLIQTSTQLNHVFSKSLRLAEGLGKRKKITFFFNLISKVKTETVKKRKVSYLLQIKSQIFFSVFSVC